MASIYFLAVFAASHLHQSELFTNIQSGLFWILLGVYALEIFLKINGLGLHKVKRRRPSFSNLLL